MAVRGIRQLDKLTPEDMATVEGRQAQQQYLEFLGRLATRLNFRDSEGGIESGRKPLNFDGIWLNYVSNAVANTEDTVAHSLGRKPEVALVGIPDKEAVVYRTATEWTKDNVFLAASAATVTVNMILF